VTTSRNSAGHSSGFSPASGTCLTTRRMLPCPRPWSRGRSRCSSSEPLPAADVRREPTFSRSSARPSRDVVRSEAGTPVRWWGERLDRRSGRWSLLRPPLAAPHVTQKHDVRGDLVGANSTRYCGRRRRNSPRLYAVLLIGQKPDAQQAGPGSRYHMGLCWRRRRRPGSSRRTRGAGP
jgi:hypothetical protein